MTLSAIHNVYALGGRRQGVVCDIGGYDFVSYSQLVYVAPISTRVVCDIGGYDFVSYSQPSIHWPPDGPRCL